jgi:putative ABC transport system substrate-binding protein
MKRREFITLLGGAVTWPLAARAQQHGRIFRIGFLSSYAPGAGKDLVGCFRKGLEKFGWIEGRNISIEYRWAEGRADRFPVFAEELVRLNLDLIASNSTLAAEALQRATRDIPVVFMLVSDPVASGIVASLARPGANITGLSNFSPALAGKMLELVKSAVPQASRVFFIFDPNPGKELDFKEIKVAANVLGMEVEALRVHTAEDVDNAFAAMAQARSDVLIVGADPVTLLNRERIKEFATKTRLPAIYQTRQFVDEGGLMSYGLNFCQHFQYASVYVDKILKGAKPADLPVELPTKFELVINLKTAKAFGLEFPPTLLARADEVIE